MFYGAAPQGPLEVLPQQRFGPFMDFAICYPFPLDPQQNIKKGQVHRKGCPTDFFNTLPCPSQDRHRDVAGFQQ